MTHFMNQHGEYIGAFDGASPPDGAISCPPPARATDRWNGTVWVPASPSLSDYTSAIDARVEEVARSRRYNSAAHMASYTASTVSAWAAEARAFVAWRDAVWTYALARLAEVEAGAATPTIAEIISGIPAPVWPS